VYEATADMIQGFARPKHYDMMQLCVWGSEINHRGQYLNVRAEVLLIAELGLI
jgi:hypothetical protein